MSALLFEKVPFPSPTSRVLGSVLSRGRLQVLLQIIGNSVVTVGKSAGAEE